MPYTHLAREEMFLVHKHLQVSCSYSEIVSQLQRHHTTISREVKRNRGYRYKQADELTKRRRGKTSSTPRKMTEALWAMVDCQLVEKRWSPEQTAARLCRDGIVSVSARWIYSHLWADRATGGTLYKSLRRRGKKPNRRGRDGCGRGVIAGRVDISERPKEAQDKSRVGDWEADTITGSRHRGALVFLVSDTLSLCF